MRHFSFKVDLRKVKKLNNQEAAQEAPRRPPPADGFDLSFDLSTHRQGMEKWPSFQRQLEALRPVSEPAPHWADQALAQEYIRIYTVSREKISEAEPGFREEGKIEVHTFFEEDGSKHVVSRVLAQPNTRVTELTLLPSGELMRLYYENAGGPDQDLNDLFEQGLGGLEEDDGRFARHPNYRLRYFLLQPEGIFLNEAFRGVFVYDPSSGGVTALEEDT